jgi:hypothetical protein
MSGHGSPALRGGTGTILSHKYFEPCEKGHIAPMHSVLAIQRTEETGCSAPKAVHCPHRDGLPPRCWGEGGRTQARLAQELFHRGQDSGAQRHEEFSERAAATVMSAIGPKRTSQVVPHMSAFEGKADMTVCENPLSRSLLGGKASLWVKRRHMQRSRKAILLLQSAMQFVLTELSHRPTQRTPRHCQALWQALNISFL